FDTVDEMALTSDRIMQASMAAAFEPIMDETMEAFAQQKKRIEKEARKSTISVMRDTLIKSTIGRFLQESGLPIRKDWVGLEDRQYGKPLEELFGAFMQNRAMKQMGGMMGMSGDMLDRMSRLTLVTPSEDIRFVRRNERLLPPDLRFDD
ncbi:MAG: hypothetical protein AAF679_14595, partial [Pseudomonadota bacterium]